MARDASLYARKAIVAALKADAAVAAIVADRVYGPSVKADPTLPFVRYGPPISVPRLATGLDGSIISVSVHGFADGPDETEASNLAAAIATALDGKTMPLGTSYPARLQDIRWKFNQVIPDPEIKSGWHSISSFEIKITS